MSSLHRAALSVALTAAPVLAMGCAQMPRQTVCHPPAESAPAVSIAAAHPMGDGSMNLARQEEGRGNFVQAKQLYEDVYRQDPGNVECCHRLGVVCTRLNLHQEADRYLRQAHAKTPNDAELLADMGYAAFMKKDYLQAESLLEQSIKLNGNNPRSINNLAIAKAWCGKDEGSLAMFRIVSNETEALRRLEIIQIARGDQARTKPVATQVIDVPPAPAAPEFLAKYKTPNLNVQTSEFTLPVSIAGTRLSNEAAILPTTSAPSIELTNHTVLSPEVDVQIELPPPAPEATVAEVPTVDHSPSFEHTDDLENVFEQEEIPAPEPTAAQASAEPVLPVTEIQEEPAWDAIAAEVESAREPVSVAVSDPVDAPTVTESRPLVLTAWRKTPQAHGGSPDSRSLEWHGQGVHHSAMTDTAMFDDKGVCRTCLVTLFEESRIVSGTSTYTFEYQSRRYRFSSAEALRKFQATPHRYAPAAGGLDVVAVRNDRRAIQGTLQFGLWHRQQLYLFSCRENADAFFRAPSKFVAIND